MTILANVDGDRLKPILAALLLLVAIRILARFSNLPSRPAGADEDALPTFDERGTIPTAAVGGVTNGLVGAWGPVVTPFLLHKGLAPRFAIGSVNTAEVAVAVVASGSLLGSVGGGGVDFGIVAAMLIGGVIASPIAAWSIRFMPARALGIAVGALLLTTNTRELANWADVGRMRWVGYATIALVTARRRPPAPPHRAPPPRPRRRPRPRARPRRPPESDRAHPRREEASRAHRTQTIAVGRASRRSAPMGPPQPSHRP